MARHDPQTKVLKPIRKLRHWKQRFDKNAAFAWRKNITYAGHYYARGELVPEGLIPRTKIRRFWESRIIELYEFAEPNVLTGQVPVRTADDVEVIVDVVARGGNWYDVTYGDFHEKVRGKKALDKALRALPERAAAAEAEAAELAAAKVKAEDAANERAEACADFAMNLRVPDDVTKAWTEDQNAQAETFVAARIDAEDEHVEVPDFLAKYVDEFEKRVSEVFATTEEREQAIQDFTAALQIPEKITTAWTVEQALEANGFASKWVDAEDDETVEVPDFLIEYVEAFQARDDDDTEQTSPEDTAEGGDTETSDGDSPPVETSEADPDTSVTTLEADPAGTQEVPAGDADKGDDSGSEDED